MREGDFSLSTDESSSAHNRDVGQFPCPINAVYNLIRLHSRLGQTSDSLLRSFLKMFVLFCDRVDGNPGRAFDLQRWRGWWPVAARAAVLRASCLVYSGGILFYFNSHPWIVLALAGFRPWGMNWLGESAWAFLVLVLVGWGLTGIGSGCWSPASSSILFPSKLLLRL